MAKGINQYRVFATSLSPMLQNPMTDEVLDELLGGKGARKGAVTDITVEQRAEKKLCLGPNGEFGFPANYLFACLIDAGRYVQFEGKSKVSTRETSLLPAFLSIVPDVVSAEGDGFIPFIDQSVAWVADKRRGVLAANKAAVAIVRPKFPTWAFEVTVEIDEDQIAIAKMRDLFTIAGRQCGIGDFRPSKRGPFGRFAVTDFVEVKQVLPKAA
jgi:hypothetical protein